MIAEHLRSVAIDFGSMLDRFYFNWYFVQTSLYVHLLYHCSQDLIDLNQIYTYCMPFVQSLISFSHHQQTDRETDGHLTTA